MKRLFTISIALLFAAGALWAGPAAETGTTSTDGKYGGTLTRAYFAPANLDPAFANDITSGEICALWGDYLAYVDENLSIDQSRSLAEDWTVSADGLTWTFTLRKGVMFHNGEEMKSKDVKFTFDRLRDPEVGAATASIYSNIVSITTSGDYTIAFTLKQKNPDFLPQLAEYQSIIIWSGITDFATQHIYTGKFMFDTYFPEDRMKWWSWD